MLSEFFMFTVHSCGFTGFMRLGGSFVADVSSDSRQFLFWLFI